MADEREPVRPLDREAPSGGGHTYTIVVTIGILVLLVAIVLTAAGGRHEIVGSNRAACLQRGVPSRITDANNLRSDISNLQLNVPFVMDSKDVPLKVRKQVVAADMRSERRKLSEIAVDDHGIDSSDWRMLNDPTDQMIVRHNGFSCARAYPQPPLWHFLF